MPDSRAGWTSVGLFLFAFGVRCIPAPRIFEGGNVHLFGTDAYYHLRRVLANLERFPESLTFDRYINYPHGGEPIWPPLFDAFLALLAWPVFEDASPAGAQPVEALLVWLPPLLGAATVVIVHRLALRLFDSTTALVSAGILALLSGHYWYSQIGFVDHHAAVALLGTAVLAVAARWLIAPSSGPAVRWPWVAALGLLLAALLLVWPGALLHVGVLEAALICWFSTRANARDAQHAAIACSVANGIAALSVAPWALGNEWTHWSSFSPAVLTNFQPWLFTALSVHALACALSWRGGWGDTRGARVGVTVAIGLAVLGLSVSFFPALQGGAFEAWRWLFKEELFQAAVAESKPLFAEGEVRVAEARLSRFVYVLPLALGFLFMSTRNGGNRHAVRLLIAQTLVLALVTVLQRRFFNSLSVVLALTMGWTLVAMVRIGASRSPIVARVLAAMLAIWLLLPVVRSYQLPLRNVVEALRLQPLTLPEGIQRQRRFATAATWLRENSPATDGFADPNVQPEYGVLALWTHGHTLEYVARRPSIANNFGDDLGAANFLASYRYFQAPADEATRLARELGVRYVLMRTYVGTDRDALPRESMRYRMSGSVDELRQLANVSLVYDEPMRLPSDPGRIRIFEIR